MQRPCHYLCRRCRPAVDHHHKWYFCVDRLLGGLVGLLLLLVAAARLQHLCALGHKHAHYLHRALKQSAAVAAQVEGYHLHRLVGSQLCQGFAHRVGTLLAECVKPYISYIAAYHAIVGHRIHVDFLACDVEGQRAIGVGALHHHSELGARLSLQVFAHLLVAPAAHAVAVDHHYLVAGFQTCTRCRTPLVWLRDIHLALALHYHRPDAAILSRRNRHEVFLLLRRDIFCVGVYVVEHRIYRCLYRLPRIYRIHIECVQLLIERIEYRQIPRYRHVARSIFLLGMHSCRG